MSRRRKKIARDDRSMGNCINHEATVSWEEREDWLWEDFNDKKNTAVNPCNVAKEPSSSVNGTDQVKIRITKKQFEELFLHVDAERKQSVVVQKLLTHLLSEANRDGGGDHIGHIQWRPALQSIAEAVEY